MHKHLQRQCLDCKIKHLSFFLLRTLDHHKRILQRLLGLLGKQSLSKPHITINYISKDYLWAHPSSSFMELLRFLLKTLEHDTFLFLPHTWFYPIWKLHMIYCWYYSFPNLSPFRTLNFECPSGRLLVFYEYVWTCTWILKFTQCRFWDMRYNIHVNKIQARTKQQTPESKILFWCPCP